ncbi:diguanylate cyclase (GGDEF) domain-containing protein [Nitrosomonas aestuarii]|uniref:diguanylate cyclase n=1 Tax=Nitrosomonas aestuarii TaxID=52441 RepID=A0A1I4FEV0_9PROT|nr:sensor domain-containing diguanylate cyclase [Nitrosomonas aestuarii]SFL16458.1 diguanylate cyclase (GGDEF) domain-containing protein [Nitrosomonas aestuarii]
MKSIKSKIFVFALLSTLIPSLVLGLLSFHLNENLIKDNVKRELRILASRASHELDAWVNQNIHEGKSLTSAKIIIDALSTAANLQNGYIKVSPEILTHYLSSVHKKLETILELTVVDINKNVFASSSDQHILTEPLKNLWLDSNTSHQPLVSPPLWSEQFETIVVSIALPIVSYDDYILGQLVLTYDLQNIKPLLKGSTKSPRGEIYLFDSNGSALIATHTDVSYPSFFDSRTFQYLLNNPGESLTFRSFSQKNVIGLAYKAETLPVTIIAEKNHKDVYAAWTKQRNLYFILVSVSIFLVAIIAIYLGHSIVTPLQRLINATGQIVKGNLDISITVATRQKDEVGKLAEMFNLMTEKLRRSQTKILAANKTMLQKNQQLEKLSITDGLTGLYNRNKLNQIISDQLLRFQRNKRPFAVLMIDVDYFKVLNDKLGHVIGDEILAATAGTLTQSIRSIDFAARYGGDEFIIILTETTVKEAVITAERIRSQASEIHCKTIDKIINITLSIGIIQSEPKDISPTALISRADQALYEAKHAGRNQAYTISPDTEYVASLNSD